MLPSCLICGKQMKISGDSDNWFYIYEDHGYYCPQHSVLVLLSEITRFYYNKVKIEQVMKINEIEMSRINAKIMVYEGKLKSIRKYIHDTDIEIDTSIFTEEEKEKLIELWYDNAFSKRNRAILPVELYGSLIEKGYVKKGMIGLWLSEEGKKFADAVVSEYFKKIWETENEISYEPS